jgi:hypothetical protein
LIRIPNSSALVVANDTGNGLSISGISASNLRSQWTFGRASKGNADFYSVNVPDPPWGNVNTIAACNTFRSRMNSLGYTTSSNSAVNVRHQTIYDRMPNAGVFAYHAPGRPGALKVHDPNNNVGYITANINLDYNPRLAIDSLATNRLAGMRCVIYFGNRTGMNHTGTNGVSYNLVNSTYARGAHFVLGINGNLDPNIHVSPNNNDRWLIAFFDEAAKGSTIEACIFAGNRAYNLRSVIYQRGNDLAVLR